MNDNFENNDDCSTAAEECERFDIIENDILNNIGNQSVSDEKKRRIPAAAIFLAMIFIVVCVLTVYCIVSDINRGNLAGFEPEFQGRILFCGQNTSLRQIINSLLMKPEDIQSKDLFR